MSGPPVCSYAEVEKIEWYVDTYDFEVTSLGFRWKDCPFCAASMRSRTDKKESHVLAECESCGFWRVAHIKNVGGFQSGEPVLASRGVAKLYEVDSLDVPLADLRRFLKRDPLHLAHVNPFVFEELVASCLRSVFPDSELIKVGGRRDRGIDLMLLQTSGENYLVQIKRRSNIQKNEGVDVVRQLNGVIFRENAAKGLVITTAKRYTPDAVQETRIKSNRGSWQSIDLYGYEDIVRWLNLPNPSPYEPWKDVTGNLELSDEF
ncbi:restriction endonuclease [Bradyrhizobium sp. AUGA SZCCT0182]|uniref:restriction endonuclease n=1 Tax=Bradyrhizobium sp. AUGA SZCCT0182 TaxID=2807667 RepID=UPI001BADC520|nr:restriction endonuclease [Bradyrhizobium sp. AUGA SZCCT0182]MBR1231697.1 restriction endonuclease [Bradyrhizobium sp. AUGA SZCCT0182]